ncbi:MAG: transposase [Betaproteobacteria bacterium RBG_19FT_COMBO_58_11]|nr:MAG: transposase [Betaproteobacteria bacterium RBG_19FT_COMBO_58_11]
MKKRFTEEQIIGFLREAEAGLPIKELCRRHGFSEASYYLWRSKFGGRPKKPGSPISPLRQ